MSRTKQRSYAEPDSNLAKKMQCPRSKPHNAMEVLWTSRERQKLANPGQDTLSMVSLLAWSDQSDHRCRQQQLREDWGCEKGFSRFSRCSTLTRLLTCISRRGARGNTEVDFNVADRLEDCGSLGLEQSQKAPEITQAPQLQVIGEIVQTPQVMEQRVPVADTMIVDVLQQQFTNQVIQVVSLIDECHRFSSSSIAARKP